MAVPTGTGIAAVTPVADGLWLDLDGSADGVKVDEAVVAVGEAARRLVAG